MLYHPHPTHVLYIIPDFVGYITVDHPVKSFMDNLLHPALRKGNRRRGRLPLAPKERISGCYPPWSNPSEQANYV